MRKKKQHLLRPQRQHHHLMSEQPVLSESEQTKTSEKSDLTTKEAREQMQIDQMEDDSADHPEE